jgi:hypothetical protein
MESYVEKNEAAIDLMPKFLSYEYVAQNINNIKHDFEFVQLTKEHIKELGMKTIFVFVCSMPRNAMK